MILAFFGPARFVRPLLARKVRQAILTSTAVLISFAGAGNVFGADEPMSGPVILAELESFRELGGVLYVAAHPDDENTQLIAALARGRRCRMAYLSVTRGDGGQNVLGPEFGDELGVIRTQELLAARRVDGGRQFFTRAIDFGFSKDYLETLQIWDRNQVIGDIVRVIRAFRPDIVITRFSPQPSGTHGHHTASAFLAVEAFKLAGDPKAFPEQLGELKPWQPKRILMNGGGFGQRGGGDNSSGLRFESGGEDPVLGESFGSIAGRSRSMHKTQGFGNFGGGRGGGRDSRPETFQLLAGDPATNSIFDGVDTTWSRVPGGAEIGKQAEELIAHFDTNNAAGSASAVLELRKRLAGLPKDIVVDEKRRQLDRILQACVGLEVMTVAPKAEVVPGEEISLRSTATVTSKIPVRWLGVSYSTLGPQLTKSADLRPNEPTFWEVTRTVPTSAPLSQPYWLRDEHPPGMFKVSDPSLIGTPENAPSFPIEYSFQIGGQTLSIPGEPVVINSAAGKKERPRRVDVIAPVAIRFLSEVRLFAPGSTRSVEVELTAYRADAKGTLHLDVPPGWRVVPESQPFQLSTNGAQRKYTFNVTAPAQPARAGLNAHVLVNGVRYASERIELRYDHIPPQILQPPARTEAVGLDLAIRGKKVGYLPGAGDSVAEALEQMGYEVTRLTGANLTAEGLRGLDAVVIGIRALNVRTDLGNYVSGLFAYVEGGGNVIVQYNRPNDLKTDKIAPFDLRISADRVTDENAAITFLAPDHPALTTPNRITNADFTDWVQERGLYFPNQWDEHFTPILACNDPGESPKKGGLLVAKYGQGYYVYTGLAWFRQLPAGVPGAYRLFANLVSLGK
jgi:LmbE family N-acetylglucosaminyl deacetylase